MRRLSSSVCLATIMSLVLAAPTLAAPPSNDTYAGRETIGSLPFTDSLDTSEATTDAHDAEWNETCGAPATDASVWYSFTSASDTSVMVDTSGSSYTAGIAAVTGTPGSLFTVACGPDVITFSAAAGVTYSIVVFDDQLDGTGNGGMLSLTVDEAPPPPSVDVTVDPVATFNAQTGSATVTGTVTCSGTDIELAFIDVQLSQRVGRFVVSGAGSTGFECDGGTHEWSVEVFGQNGLFKGGKAASLTFAVACDPFQCGEDFEERTIASGAEFQRGRDHHGRALVSSQRLLEHVAALDLDVADPLVEAMRTHPRAARPDHDDRGPVVTRPCFGRLDQGGADALGSVLLVHHQAVDAGEVARLEQRQPCDVNPAYRRVVGVGCHQDLIGVAGTHLGQARAEGRRIDRVAQLRRERGGAIGIGLGHRPHAVHSSAAGSAPVTPRRPSSVIVSSASRRRVSQAAWRRRPCL